MLSVSVIIATKNREDQLASISLPSLARQQDASSFEVVGSGTRATMAKSRTLVESFAAQHPGVIIRYFKAPRVGLARQRNDAVKEANGDVVFFIDDDSEVSPDGIRALADMFAADDRVAGGCLPLDYNFPAGTEPAILKITGSWSWLVRAYYKVFEPSKKASGYYPPIPPRPVRVDSTNTCLAAIWPSARRSSQLIASKNVCTDFPTLCSAMI